MMCLVKSKRTQISIWFPIVNSFSFFFPSLALCYRDNWFDFVHWITLIIIKVYYKTVILADLYRSVEQWMTDAQHSTLKLFIAIIFHRIHCVDVMAKANIGFLRIYYTLGFLHICSIRSEHRKFAHKTNIFCFWFLNNDEEGIGHKHNANKCLHAYFYLCAYKPTDIHWYFLDSFISSCSIKYHFNPVEHFREKFEKFNGKRKSWKSFIRRIKN